MTFCIDNSMVGVCRSKTIRQRMRSKSCGQCCNAAASPAAASQRLPVSAALRVYRGWPGWGRAVVQARGFAKPASANARLLYFDCLSGEGGGLRGGEASGFGGTLRIILSVSVCPGERSPLPTSGSSVRCAGVGVGFIAGIRDFGQSQSDAATTSWFTRSGLPTCTVDKLVDNIPFRNLSN